MLQDRHHAVLGGRRVTAEASNKEAPGPARRVRVALVDDNPDVRALLRIQFRRDVRFEVVGEAGDGSEAIELAEAARPDLMVLDRQMPRMSGVEAIPEIRRRAPDTSIVLYTAVADVPTYYAALAAGAIDVVEKAGPVSDFVDRLVRALLDRTSGPEASVEIRVGPVASAAARVWVPNTQKILEGVRAHPEVLERGIPADVFELFHSLLRQWGEIAATTEEFRWAARASTTDVSRIVEYWAVIDRMNDEQLELLGIHWSPPEGEVFFRALTAGVLQALGRHEETQRLAALLSVQWATYTGEAT
jgi:DNA-binding NarL/FixJ family response regulator